MLAVAAAVKGRDERADLQVQALGQFAAHDEFVALAAAKEPALHAFEFRWEVIQGHSDKDRAQAFAANLDSSDDSRGHRCNAGNRFEFLGGGRRYRHGSTELFAANIEICAELNRRCSLF